MKVELVAYTPHGEYVIDKAAAVCYHSEPREDGKRVKSCIQRGHESVIEHAVATFLISEISRACSFQLVRHRLASYCLAGDTTVTTYRKSYKCPCKSWTVSQLYAWSQNGKKKEELKFINLNGINENNEIEAVKIKNIFHTGYQRVYCIRTENNHEIRATAKHRLLTSDGWKYLHDLSVGNILFANNAEVDNGRHQVREDKIISIKPDGFDDTYDIEIDGPWHNFIANGLVVHNSQESQRYCDTGEWVPVIPKTILEHSNPDLLPRYVQFMSEAKRQYSWFRQQGIPKEDARFVLPNATPTTLIMTANLREWRHIINLRANKAAQWEIRDVVLQILGLLADIYPVVFEDLKEKYLCADG